MINLINREKEPSFLLLFAFRPFIYNNYFNELIGSALNEYIVS